MILLTKKWRKAMASYLERNGLPHAGKVKGEEGWVTNTDKPFGKPARHVIRRVANHLEARGLLKPEDNDGTLNTAMQKLLIPPPPPLFAGDLVVKYALTQVGVHESPWGSNSGADVRRYQSSTGAYGQPWCASFDWYCWQKAANYKGPVSAGAWYSTDHIGTRQTIMSARPGDLVSFDVGDGHVGLFLSRTSSAVRTVDGNTSDQVAVRDRAIRIIHSISRPLK